jgi:hypothetical protein
VPTRRSRAVFTNAVDPDDRANARIVDLALAPRDARGRVVFAGENDRAGIRLPEVAAPLGTYTGWNLRRPEMGAVDQLARWNGSFFPFASTEAERAKDGDPRPSLEARYKTKGDYLRSVEVSVSRLAGQGFLLAEDAEAYLTRASTSSWPLDEP